jgi:hypothetical protein
MKYDPRLGSTDPHPDHFDANKFSPSGYPIGPPRGRASRIRPEQAEQALFLDKIVRTAEKDLDDYLISIGYAERHERKGVLARLRTGWRPVK